MAHYAWIDSNNKVINVTVGVDENLIQTDTDGKQIGGNTEAWEIFYTNAINQDGVYIKRTSYNGNIRKNYAGIGYTYDKTRDAFIPPKPYNSWILNEDTCRWESPVPYPADGKRYNWNEDTQSWDEVTE